MRQKQGFTMIELLVAMTVFGLLCFAVYRTTWQYFRAYMKTDDQLENLTEAWQVLRLIKEDLAFADFPGGDRANWRDFVRLESGNRILINRRFDDTMMTVAYDVDLKNGNLARGEETLPGKGTLILRQRLKNLSVETVTRPDSTTLPSGELPQAVSFKISLELAKIQLDSSQVAPLVLETTVVPMFANARLQSRYCSASMPVDLVANSSP